MKVIGIICEYNPLHNGHMYHLKKIKEMFPDSLVILILNGYFLQRGEVSIISKENKTRLALEIGIDIILELPFVFGTQSADVFANASITFLEELHCDYVVFGSESNNLDILNKVTDYVINNSKEYNQKIKFYLNQGFNYPTATSKALNIDFIFKSNDLLGISYLKSIKLNNYKIKPLTIQRTNEYLDTTSNDDIISATNIREKIKENKNIAKYVPESVFNKIENISLENYFTILKYKIITDKDLSIYLDVDEGIQNRLKKIINNCNSISELIEQIKSKRYTYNKIRRMLIHILIGFTKEDNLHLQYEYIKIIGFNNRGKKYLNNIKKNMHIPFTINKSSLIYKYELKSAIIYDLITNNNATKFEKNNQPINLI